MSGSNTVVADPLRALSRAWQWLGRWYGRSYTTVLLCALVLAVAIAFMLPRMLINIPAGHGGVLWRRFDGGTVFAPALGEGYQLIWPWDRITIYDLRLRQFDTTLNALGADGLNISVQVAIRYRLSPANLAYLDDGVGRNYEQVIIKPELAAAVQTLVAMYPAESLLGTLRDVIQHNIYTTLTNRSRLNQIGALNPRTGITAISDHTVDTGRPATARQDGLVNTKINQINRPLILLQDVLIARVILPQRLRMAIEAKLEQRQHSEEYQYRLESERFESERKAIEAEGIRRFQDIVSKGITPSYLKWRGIEATEALARSPNAKIVVIGGANGLPLILNAGEGNATPSVATVHRPQAPPASTSPSPPVAEPLTPPSEPLAPPSKDDMPATPGKRAEETGRVNESRPTRRHLPAAFNGLPVSTVH